MFSQSKCDGLCSSCINRFVSGESDNDTDKLFCKLFEYEYEAITLKNATSVLMNPRISTADKRILVAILQSSDLDPSVLYKDSKIPDELIL